MERDFLGIGGKDVPAVKEEAAGFLGSSAVNWPFSNKIPAMQQFVNLKAAQEERQRKIMFEHLSSSGFQPMSTVGVFDAIHQTPSVLVSQKYLGCDRQGINHFQQPGFPALGADPFSNSAVHHSNEVRMLPVVTHHPIPIATSCPFPKLSGSTNGSSLGFTSLKQQPPFIGGSAAAPPGGGSMTAAFASRYATKPCDTAAKLTIFYGGMVNVYEDVPLEKAQAIMFLAAASGSNVNPNVASFRTQIPAPALTRVAEDEAISTNQAKIMNQVQTQRTAAQPCTKLCNPMPSTSHPVAQSGSGHSSPGDLIGTKTPGPLIPTGQHEPPKAIVTAIGCAAGPNLIPRAIPQARKASLARFLEKRKERVTITAPYPPPQKSSDCTSGFDDKSMTAETAHSSTKEQSWHLSAHKNSSSSSNSPSTKLEI